MTVNLNSLCITNYDSKKDEDTKFLEEISRDEEISKNLDDVPLSLERSNGVSNLRLGIAYLVKEEENLIGLIRLDKKNSNCHDISVDIAIHPFFRHKGYGTILLKEISDYIFKNSTLIEKIKLNVNRSNESGAKCATSADFSLESDSEGVLSYSKLK